MPDYQLTDSTIVIRLADGANIPNDPANADYQRYEQWLAAGGVPLPLKPQASDPAQLQAMVVQSTQQRLDDFARTRNYDGILSACTYATSSVPKFATEGQYAVQARDATWAALYVLLAEVQAGTRPMPTSYDDVEQMLPTLEWPV